MSGNSLQNILTCLICMERYTEHPPHDPLMYPHCGHTVCRNCCLQCAKINSHCVTCRTPFHGVPADFPRNIAIIQMIPLLDEATVVQDSDSSKSDVFSFDSMAKRLEELKSLQSKTEKEMRELEIVAMQKQIATLENNKAGELQIVYEVELEIDQTEIVLSTLREKKELAQQRILGIDKELAKLLKTDKLSLLARTDPSSISTLTSVTDLVASDFIVDMETIHCLKQYIPSVVNIDEAIQALHLIAKDLDNEYFESSIVMTFRALFNLVKDNQANQAALGARGACELIAAIFNRFLVVSPIMCQECLAVIHIMCRCSDNMITSSDVNISAFVATETCIPDVVTALSLYAGSHPQLAVNGLITVHRLAYLSSVSLKLGDAGVCTAIAEGCLFRHRSHIVIVEWSFRSIRNLTAAGSDPNTAKMAAVNGFCETVYQSIKRNIQSALIVTQACGAMVNLGVDHRLKTKFGKLGFCSLICAIIQSFESNAEVIENAIWALRNLSTDSANKSLIGKANGCKILVDAMLFHLNSALITEQGCRALLNLAIDDENDATLGEVGVCELLPNVLKMHVNRVSICQQACWAIRNLSSTLASNRIKFGHAGVCAWIVKACRTHTSDVVLTEQACRAILNLSCEPANEELLGQGGACVAVVTALKAHPANGNVCEQALWAIRNLSSGDNIENRKRFHDCLAAVHIIDASQTHIAQPSIVEQGCRALANLSIEDENSRDIGEQGGCELVLQILNSFPVLLVDPGLKALCSLTKVKENVDRLNILGGLESLCRCIVIFDNMCNTLVVEWGIKLIKVLIVERNHSNQRRLGDTGVFSLLANVLTCHPNSEPIVQQIVDILPTIICPENKYALVECNMKEKLASTLQIQSAESIIYEIYQILPLLDFRN